MSETEGVAGVEARLRKYVEYVRSTGQAHLATAQFDDDWEPIGPQVRADLLAAGLTLEEAGLLTLTDRSHGRAAPPEGITFEQLVEHGLAQEGANIVDGLPWSFVWDGYPVTHERTYEGDDLYLVGYHPSVRVGRGDVVVTTEYGLDVRRVTA